MTIDTTYYRRCILTLEKAHGLLNQADFSTLEYEMYRSASIKEFEIILEQSAKLLKKILKPHFATPKTVDQLSFKDCFRQALLKNYISVEACERWMHYRDNRNNTAHDYGVNFAEQTLILLPQFINDANDLAEIIAAQKID